jgi:two-component system phosphate regulon response regulator PhoB
MKLSISFLHIIAQSNLKLLNFFIVSVIFEFMVKILLIEDDPTSQILVARTLSNGPFELLVANSSQSALDTLEKNKIQLIILDLTLPDLDGMELCAQLQGQSETKDIPIFVLTGHADLPNKVAAFSMGVEDYIVKPFNPLEFRARIESKLRKLQKVKDEDEVLDREGINLNVSRQKAFIISNGARQDIGLTPLEFKILYQLARREERVMSREQLLDKVWGSATIILDRTVDSHISSLRKKMGVLSRYIESIPREGYRFSTHGSSSEV